MRLHDRIMNIPIASDFDYSDFPSKVYAYKSGHRDARHAAAEMSLIADELLDSLEGMVSIFPSGVEDDGSGGIGFNESLKQKYRSAIKAIAKARRL